MSDTRIVGLAFLVPLPGRAWTLAALGVESSTTITGLTAGEHIIWVVLGDGTHKAFDPPVMDKLTVVVQ